MVFTREGFETEMASVSKIRGWRVRPLVPLEAVRPFERLAAVGTHVVPRGGVGVHVRGQVLLEPGGVLAELAFEQRVPGLFGLFDLLY